MKCPMCEGQGTTWMGLENEIECSYCYGSGEVSKKSLYSVDVSFTMMVWAENAIDAQNVAAEFADEELFHADYSVHDDIDCGWYDCIPYGDCPDEFEHLNVREIIAKQKEIQEAVDLKNYVDPNQLELFA